MLSHTLLWSQVSKALVLWDSENNDDTTNTQTRDNIENLFFRHPSTTQMATSRHHGDWFASHTATGGDHLTFKKRSPWSKISSPFSLYFISVGRLFKLIEGSSDWPALWKCQYHTLQALKRDGSHRKNSGRFNTYLDCVILKFSSSNRRVEETILQHIAQIGYFSIFVLMLSSSSTHYMSHWWVRVSFKDSG